MKKTSLMIAIIFCLFSIAIIGTPAYAETEGLKDAIGAMITGLEEGTAEEFIDEFVDPDVITMGIEQLGSKASLISAFADRKDQLLISLRECFEKEPDSIQDNIYIYDILDQDMDLMISFKNDKFYLLN